MVFFLFSSRRTFNFTTYCRFASLADLDSPLALLRLLQFSAHRQSLQLTKQCHAQISVLGFSQNPFLTSKLISAFAVCGSPAESKLVFESVQHQTVYLWNSLINGYVKNLGYDDAFGLFNEMCRGSVLPDDFTLATILKACGDIENLEAGKLAHGKSVRLGFVSDTVVANSLLSMYSKCREFGNTRNLFDEMPYRNVSSWNVLISAYANLVNGDFNEDPWEVVKVMQTGGVKPDAFTVSSLLSLCTVDIEKCDYGKELHCYALRNRLVLAVTSDVYLGSCLIDMYSRSGRVVLSRRVFDQMESRNIYAWTAMIGGYAQNGILDEALVLFREMLVRDRIVPNKVSLVSVLPACSSLAGLLGGKQIHGFAIRKNLNHDVALCNALMDMYAKSGGLNYASHIFEDGSFSKDAVSWSTMISGFGLHGMGEKAILLYDQMLELGNKPDMITVIGVLSACGRSGLVKEGLRIYNSAICKYSIKPTSEICACVVDMLGRSGHLHQALAFINKMPVEAGPSVWGALVSSSLIHGNYAMQDLAYRFLIQVEPRNPSNYVAISNLHASSRKWDAVAEVRTMMHQKGLKKAPGCSWISVNGKTHCFYVADQLHSQSNSIYKMLDDLLLVMKRAGYSRLF